MFNDAERIANFINDDLYDIPDVKSVEYPMELNSIIVVMKNGKRYRITVEEEEDS